MFPSIFSSQKEYDSYLACISNLKIGDKITATTLYGEINGFFLYKENDVRNSNGCIILIGSENPLSIGVFHSPTISEKKRYLTPAKIYCPKIRIGTTKLFWLPATSKLSKIVKYNGRQEEKEKKEKAKAAKSLRASRKYA